MRGWQELAEAPRDGTPIQLKIVHSNRHYARSAEEMARWEDEVTGHWIDHNGGGWTWYGMAGEVVAWRPLSDNLDSSTK